MKYELGLCTRRFFLCMRSCWAADGLRRSTARPDCDRGERGQLLLCSGDVEAVFRGECASVCATTKAGSEAGLAAGGHSRAQQQKHERRERATSDSWRGVKEAVDRVRARACACRVPRADTHARSRLGRAAQHREQTTRRGALASV